MASAQLVTEVALSHNLPSAAELFPVNADERFPPKPGRTARWRWIHRGVTAPDGRKVKLHAVRVGRIWFTCKAWWDEFMTALNPETATQSASVRSPAQRNRAADQAEAKLIAKGA